MVNDKEDSKLPEPDVNASIDGKRNAYYHMCEVHGQKRPYAVCCSLPDRKDDPAVKEVYESCLTAINRNRCPAVAMRREEVQKGAAIYFVERKSTERAGATEFIAAAIESVAVTMPNHAEPLDMLTMAKMGYGDLIKEMEKGEKKPEPAISVGDRRPGETPLEMARRMLAERLGKKSE